MEIRNQLNYEIFTSKTVVMELKNQVLENL